jgi:4-hydroxy-tetrahydrodipicolinate reductase
MIRVGVVGAAGRMGRTVCSAVAADPDLVFVCGVDTQASRADGEILVEGVEVAEQLHAFADTECDVVVDFTVADAARATVPWLALHGMHAVVGTTGFTDADIELFESSFAHPDGVGPNCLIAPNFAIPRS